jgi:predicted phosphodiesterase
MRLGLISDIHGKLCALEAVLADILYVDKIICTGDILGYGPQPTACLDRVRDVCSLVVQGNQDRWVERPDSYA